MPLVRVQVRNQYALGTPDLYTDTNREDPKAVLDGVAVAGLVGILRQLGDLAEFAAEVFHGLQEQVLITSSRSHKMVQRVHAVEAALPPLEKAILAQRSHLHFAYTAGSHWHTRIRTEHNHFIYSDLPRCVMEPYEDCRDPPRLSKLDKFDIGGPGSCFKRYSDSTYFKRSSVGPYETHLQTVPREKKARRNKKKRSSSRYRDVTHDTPVIMHGGRTDFGSVNLEEKASVPQDVSQKPEIDLDLEVDHLTSFDSKNESGYIECIFRPSCSTQSEDNNAKEASSDSNVQVDSVSLDENINNGYLLDDNKSKSTYITWDEKLEIIDSTNQPNESTEIPCANDEKEDLRSKVVDRVDHVDFDFRDEQEEPSPTPVIVRGQHDEIESETDYYMDALNTIESESENDLDCHTKQELKRFSDVDNKRLDFENKESQIDDISTDFEFHVPEKTYLTPMSISHEAHTEVNGSSNIEKDASSREPSPQPVLNEPVITHESTEPSASTSGGQTTVSNPVMFWTNGGLLGLEPSKPPDFGLPAVVSPEPVEEAKTAINDVKPESPGQLPGADDPITSSRVFEFSNRLLANGFRKQISLVGNETLANSVKTDVPENPTVRKGYQSVTGIPFREQFGNRNPLVSPSSPPLEHMRISFQPIDGFQTSKLKLAFPDANNNNNNNVNNNNGNMFPSFQLVPETASLHEFDSDFDDDDTFCRSSPYESDHPSESNSEQWDSSESPRLKDHELDDAFGRISSAESVSTSQVNGHRFQSDIPNLDYVKASQDQVTNGLKGPTPPPPPLPPMEWRGNGIKPNPDDLSETLTYALNLTPTQHTPPQQPKPVTRKQESVVETGSVKVKPKPDWRNLHAQNGSTHIINGKVGDEREDFLKQIRDKSRNLRRISTAPPTTTPAGPASINVTAIIEKASAIRQVVGSDDGEDNWSDS